MRSQALVWGTPMRMAFLSGGGVPTYFQPITLVSSHLQNFLQPLSLTSVSVFILLQIKSLEIHAVKFLLAAQIGLNEQLAVYGIVTHIEFHKFGYGFLVAEFHLVQAYVISDELREFVVADFSLYYCY